MGQQWVVRLRILLDEYVGAVLVAMLALAVVGGYLTVGAYAEPNTSTEQVEVASWESTGTFEHSATVVEDTAVYDRGTTLQDRTTYFQGLTPRLNGTFRYSYTASDGGSIEANASTVLILHSVTESDEGETEEYWRLEETLGRETVDSLSPDESLAVPFETNVTAAAQRLDAVDQQFGTTPGQKELLIETRVHLSGTRNGRPVDTTRTYQLPITLSGNVYQMNDPGRVTESDTRTESQTVTVEPGPIPAYGGPALLALGLVGALAVGVARFRGWITVSEGERQWLRYQQSRTEFDDWITTARIPDVDTADSIVRVDSLDGLVDLAIDTDERVLEDRTTNRFFVFDEERTYAYDPPARSTSTEDVLQSSGAGGFGSILTDSETDDAGSDGSETDEHGTDGADDRGETADGNREVLDNPSDEDGPD